MRMIKFLAVAVFLMLFLQSCDEPTMDYNSLMSTSSGAHLVVPNVPDGVVLRVVGVDSLTFTGVIVQTPNEQNLCDTVSAYKHEWKLCKTCTDGCQ